jgi:hypothetical protein
MKILVIEDDALLLQGLTDYLVNNRSSSPAVANTGWIRHSVADNPATTTAASARDYVVDKAIKLLQSKQDRFTTSLVYLSDHGESLGEDGGFHWYRRSG